MSSSIHIFTYSWGRIGIITLPNNNSNARYGRMSCKTFIHKNNIVTQKLPVMPLTFIHSHIKEAGENK
jgi:hypothetical protein